MQTPTQIAERIAESEKFKGLTVEDLGLSVEQMMVAAIEADRAQREAEYADPPVPADERFPDRPEHPDFARLAVAVELVDNYPKELSPPEAIGIDDGSLSYMAVNRMGTGLRELGPLTLLIDPITTMASAWCDGLAVGIEYHRRGGNRPAETGTTAGEGSAE